MVEVPLFALGLQPGGCMTLEKAQRYIDNCRSRRRYYRVMVFESGTPSPESLKDIGDITQWAYQRALNALEHCKDAVAGIGLQSALHRFVMGRKIVPVRMAAAVLVQRDEPDSPIILVASNGENLDAQAQLVARALSSWRSRKEPRALGRSGPLIQAMAKRVIGL